MRWRDIRFEKPTEADADKDGRILQLLSNGICGCFAWSSLTCVIAWCPMSELPAFEPIPDPPEGWRFVGKGEAFDKRAKFWSKTSSSWLLTGHCDDYSKVYTYIIPINPPEPPEPQYRQFANAKEFDGWAFNFWRYKDDLRSVRRPPVSYSDDGHYGDKWDVSLIRKEFADGSPFGVKVQQ